MTSRTPWTAQNLLHRDVKPANILLTETAGTGGRRRVMLADFGIARPILGDTKLTATNLTVGSFAYSSPEQLAGEPLSGRADQYSLACTAYQLLGGSTPFELSNPAALIHHHMSVTPPPITARRADLSPRVDAVLGRALEKDAQERYPSCVAFADDLAAALRSNPVAPDVTPAPPTVAPPPRRPTGYLSGPGVSPSGSAPTSSAGYGYTPPAYAATTPAQPLAESGHAGPAHGYPAAGAYQQGPDPRAYSHARWALICAVASIPLGCLILPGLALAPLAIYFGQNSLKLSSASRYSQAPADTGRGMAIAGITVGAIGLLWSILMLIGFIGSLGSP